MGLIEKYKYNGKRIEEYIEKNKCHDHFTNLLIEHIQLANIIIETLEESDVLSCSK